MPNLSQLSYARQNNYIQIQSSDRIIQELNEHYGRADQLYQIYKSSKHLQNVKVNLNSSFGSGL